MLIGFYNSGVQCGVEEALRATRSDPNVERPTARFPANVRNERAITMGSNRQLIISARRPSSGFSTDVRETDRQHSMAGGGLNTKTQQHATNSAASSHPKPAKGKRIGVIWMFVSQCHNSACVFI